MGDNRLEEKLLKDLTTDELINLRNKIDFILETKNDNGAELFYSVIVRKLQERGTNCAPFLNACQDRIKRKVNKIASELRVSYGIKDMNIVSFYDLFCDIMIDYLEKIEVPVSVETILNNYSKFDSLLSYAFPGYHKKLFYIRGDYGKKRIDKRIGKDKQ